MKQVKVLTQSQINLLADIVNEYWENLPMFDSPKELDDMREVLIQALVIKVEYSDSPHFSE